MSNLMETLEVVYTMGIGQTIEFTSGAVLVRTKKNAFQVTDKNGKTYSSLNKDHAAMIANAGE